MKKLEPKKLKVVVSVCLYDSMDVCQSTEQACQLVRMTIFVVSLETCKLVHLSVWQHDSLSVGKPCQFVSLHGSLTSWILLSAWPFVCLTVWKPCQLVSQHGSLSVWKPCQFVCLHGSLTEWKPVILSVSMTAWQSGNLDNLTEWKPVILSVSIAVFQSRNLSSCQSTWQFDNPEAVCQLDRLSIWQFGSRLSAWPFVCLTVWKPVTLNVYLLDRQPWSLSLWIMILRLPRYCWFLLFAFHLALRVEPRFTCHSSNTNQNVIFFLRYFFVEILFPSYC